MRIKIRNTIFKNLDANSQLYIILFVIVMFSGSTFISNYVMQLVCLLVLMMFSCVKVKGIQNNGYRNKNETLYFSIMILIISFLIYQLSFSYDKKTTFVFVLRFVAFTLFTYFIPSIDITEKIVQAIKVYSYPVAISIMITTLINGKKSGGLVGDYQFAGMMMSISFIFLLVSYYSEKNKTDLYGIILMALALLTSGKRSFTALIFVSYIVVFLIYHSKKNNVKFLKLSTLSMVGLVLAYIFIPAVRLVAERLQAYSGDTTYNGRAFFWTAAIDIFHSKRMTGIGMGCFSAYFDQYFHRLGNMDAYDAHNVYIQLLAETGIIGELLFIFLFMFGLTKTFLLLAKPSVKNDKQCKAILSISFLLQIWFILYCMTGNPLYGASQSFFYFAALSMMFSVKKYMMRGQYE